MWAARPHLANIFEKLLDQKTFICLRLGNCSRHGKTAYFHELFHVKHCTWETNCIRFGKAGAHPQLALGIAIAPETLTLIATF